MSLDLFMPLTLAAVFDILVIGITLVAVYFVVHQVVRGIKTLLVSRRTKMPSHPRPATV